MTTKGKKKTVKKTRRKASERINWLVSRQEERVSSDKREMDEWLRGGKHDNGYGNIYSPYGGGMVVQEKRGDRLILSRSKEREIVLAKKGVAKDWRANGDRRWIITRSGNKKNSLFRLHKPDERTKKIYEGSYTEWEPIWDLNGGVMIRDDRGGKSKLVAHLMGETSPELIYKGTVNEWGVLGRDAIRRVHGKNGFTLEIGDGYSVEICTGLDEILHWYIDKNELVTYTNLLADGSFMESRIETRYRIREKDNKPKWKIISKRTQSSSSSSSRNDSSIPSPSRNEHDFLPYEDAVQRADRIHNLERGGSGESAVARETRLWRQDKDRDSCGYDI